MAFSPDTFKETVKRLHCLCSPDCWPRGRPLIQNYPCSILAGSRSLWRLGQSVAELQEEPRLPHEVRGRLQVPSAAHELCVQHCVSCPTNRSNRGSVTCRTLIIFAVFRSTWDLFETWHFCIPSWDVSEPKRED